MKANNLQQESTTLKKKLAVEMEEHLVKHMIPFWEGLKDTENGGYYGYMGYNLEVDQNYLKGCILNSRITWFFSNAYTLLKDEKLLEDARWGYEFLKNYCIDQKNGGVYWSVTYDGAPKETLKHTYNQAFSIYALASYYEASKDREALDIAYQLYDLIEGKMRDEQGYLESFDETFHISDNDKLSENGVMAYRTMNTLLHVFEAYTELYRVDHQQKVKEKIMEMMDAIIEKIYNPKLHRQEVFFDKDWNSLIDLHSYGHDIETAWLVDRSLEVIQEEKYTKLLLPITKDLTRQVYEVAFQNNSLCNECEKGVVDTDRIWWVQAETIVGFVNGYEKHKEFAGLLQAAEDCWEYVKENLIDKRSGSEWFWKVSQKGLPYEGYAIVEPWKCPYHNGRMCMEIIKRERLGVK